MKTQYWLIVSVIILAVGVAVGRYTLPARVEVKTVTQIVEKKVIVDKVDTTTTTKSVHESKTGKDTTTTTVVDRRHISTQDNTTSNSTQDSTKTYNTAVLSVAATAGYSLSLDKMVYGAVVQKKFWGPLWIGGYGNTGKEAGLTLGLLF